MAYGDEVNEKSDLFVVAWFKGADKIEKSDKVKSVKTGNTFKLDLKSVDAEDSGLYTVKIIKEKKAIAKYTASLNVFSAA